MTDWKERAEKAEARVAVLREALKLIVRTYDNLISYAPLWLSKGREALATEDQAAEALLAELKHLRGIVWGDHPHDVNKMCAEIDGLKAQLDVAVDALSAWLKAYDDTGDDNGPSLVERECADKARAALAKIKAVP